MKSLTTIMSLATFLFATVTADAACLPKLPPKEALKKAYSVFTGKVTGIKQTEEGYDVTITVTRHWKGVTAKTLVVRAGFADKTPSGVAAYGYPFKQGKSYLVYTYQHPKTKDVWTSICNRTTPLAKAKVDLKELGPGKPASKK